MALKTIPLFKWSEPRIRTLHYTWLAFFITFLIWFAHAPLMPVMKEYFDLSPAQVKAILMLNVAITIPARILIGVLVDKFGPRKSYSFLLALCGALCLLFAAAQSFEWLAISRFLLGFVGAGFVIGIRLVSEWFPAREVGIAEGVYGGWGNFGAAVASMSMPVLALAFGGEDGWRYAIASTGIIAIIYSVIFYRGVRDTPEGSTYFKPQKAGGLEVSSKSDFVFYALMNVPLYLALALLTWRLSPSGLNLLSADNALIAYVVIAALAFYQWTKIWHVNKHLFDKDHVAPTNGGYKFKQVAILNVAYMACFGSELAVVSMLPLFFIDTFHISPVYAGMTAGCFAVMNLFARPGGGLFSDSYGRRKMLIICLLGQTIGYVAMSQMSGAWALPMAIATVLATSVFVQGACGAVYSVVPLIQRRMTGQIAGMAGAYGNVGGVTFLTILSMVSPSTFFWVLAGISALALTGSLFIDEPKGHMVEKDEQGNVHLIAVE
ncbi:MAG: MFS transporter [Pseudomonadales bacterium]|nr:MFS transporter [Pseudomonadales bacterium]